MVEIGNGLLLAIGFILVLTSVDNFTRSFAIWWALFPLVIKLTPIEGLVIPSCRLITSALFVIAVFKFLNRRKQFPAGAFWNSYVFFLVLASISAIISEQPVEALGKTFTYLEPLMWAIMAAYCAVSDKNALRTISKGILWGLAGVIAYGVVEAIYQASPLYDSGLLRAEIIYITDFRFGSSGRIMSTIGQPLGTSLYFVATLPLIIFYGKYLTRSLAKKLLCFLLLATGLFCLVTTGSRTGYAAVLIVPLAYYAFNMSSLRTMAFILATYAMFFVMVQYLLPPDFMAYMSDSIQISGFDRGNVAVGNTLGRINLTERLLEIWQENPFFGLGPGYIPRMDAAGVPKFIGLGGSENQYAMLLAETGVVGMLGYAIFVFCVLRLLVTASKRNSPAKVQWASFAGSILLAILVAAVSVTIIASIAAMLIMTYLGLAVVFAKERVGAPQVANQGTPGNSSRAYLHRPGIAAV
jgi:hypothetical protein